jgi:hypothetical protein
MANTTKPRLSCFDDNDLGEDNLRDIPGWQYFAFTEENIKESGVEECYAKWSADTHSLWGDRGEVGYFASQFADTDNFKCGFDIEGSCIDMPTRGYIETLYPGPDNRARVRRILFQFMRVDYQHRIKRQDAVRFRLA